MNKGRLINGKKETMSSRAPNRKLVLTSSAVATFAGFDHDGRPLINLPGSAGGDPVPARHTCMLAIEDIGRETVLTFEDGDPSRPIILGVLQPAQTPGSPTVRSSADGSRLEVTASQEIVLRSGKASITLTRAGKIIIRGAYILSRSSGVNRVKGGSVQIN